MVSFIFPLCVRISPKNAFASLMNIFFFSSGMNMKRGNTPKDFWRKRTNALKIWKELK